MHNPTLCIYHGNCADGFGAAWAVWKKFPDIQFHAGVYGQSAPDVRGHHVVMVDFSYPLETMEKIIAAAISVTVIDHHKTAAEAIQPLLDQGKIYGVFDMDHSGAVLAWKWFHSDTKVPNLLQHIEDRDLWRFNMPNTREIQAAVFSYPYDFEVWDGLVTIGQYEVMELAKQGEAIERKHHKDVAELVEVTKRIMVIGDYPVWVANLPYTMASDACHTMCHIPIDPQVYGQTKAPFAASYYDKPEGRVFSLRSIGDFDVSAIAKKYGGGGHKNAAGFTVPVGWEGE